jgi:hypothetical protein
VLHQRRRLPRVVKCLGAMCDLSGADQHRKSRIEAHCAHATESSRRHAN